MFIYLIIKKNVLWIVYFNWATRYFIIKFQDIPEDFDIKQKVNEILMKCEADQMRARTMDIDDFMKLLHAFNSEGIHFA